jgi:hypothetical protein
VRPKALIVGDLRMGLSLRRLARFAPREPRSAVEIETSLLLPHDEVAPITIRNLSRRGFMGETQACPKPDTWLGVSLPGGGIMRALVRWSQAGEVGCQFRAPLDVERIRQTLSKTGQSPDLFGPARCQRSIHPMRTENEIDAELRERTWAALRNLREH